MNNKIMNKFFKNASALLLSFLIMSALLVSVLYIARIVQRQIITSRSTDNSNIAFYAAESGNEQAIYYIRKNKISDVSDLNIISPLIFEDSGASIIRSVEDGIYNINIGLERDNFFQFDLYDPSNLAGESSNVSYLEIFWSDDCGGDSWIELTANDWNLESTDWGNDELSLEHVKKSLLNNPPYTREDNTEIKSIGGSSLRSENSYQFRVRALFCDIYNLNISAFDPSNKLLKFKNIYNIKTIGQYPSDSSIGNKQALSVSLRSRDPLSGLFDYVIFSEQSLIKDIGVSSGSPILTFYIAEPSPMNLEIGEEINHEILVINGRAPFEWDYSGSLPQGVEFDAENGLLRGRPADSGSFLVIFKVKDSSGGEAVSKQIMINVIKTE